MDKAKKIILSVLASVLLIHSAEVLSAQNVSEIKFCDRKYEYTIGKDTITLYFNLLDKFGNRVQELLPEQLENYLVIKEDGEFIPQERTVVSRISSGQRIPSEYTFSVLIDSSIPENGKEQIYNTVGRLVESAPDSCVFLSFFGDDVTSSNIVTKENYKSFKDKFFIQTDNKYFYSGLYAKLLEFSEFLTAKDSLIRGQEGYIKNEEIAKRAKANVGKNILFVFTEGSKRPTDEDLMFEDVVKYQGELSNIVPKVIALYYTDEENQTGIIENTLKGICIPRDENGNLISALEGKYLPSNDMAQVLVNFEEVVNDAMYDYSFAYKVDKSQSYSRIVKYSGEWKGSEIGTGEFSIGSPERAWPYRVEEAGDIALKYLYACLITLGTILFFFGMAKILVPFVRSKSFAAKYYRKYVPEANVSRRICHYCKQDIQPGQMVVTKCKHIMHVFCWQQNGYKCAEYGQNCKIGIQSHIEWKELFTLNSLKDCYQVISGITAGFISWLLYELFGRDSFNGLSEKIVGIIFGNESDSTLYIDCVNKTSAFLAIGLFLGFFLSLIFRYNDEYKKKDIKVVGKIVGLSLLSGVTGMIAFALGSIILSYILIAIDTTYIPWYCSLPAYLLFSISVSLILTIQSTIPMKSALLGGLCSSVIGFVVLYYSSRHDSAMGWMNMLLDFIIYGGGLGASLVTVRMLAEKYYLVIQNGIRAGQRIPIHKWMNATGGGNKVKIGMTGECEIQMNWEKSNKVAKEHVQLFIDYDKQLPMLNPMATGVIYNTRAELPVGKPTVLSNGDNFKIGDTIFTYVETE